MKGEFVTDHTSFVRLYFVVVFLRRYDCIYHVHHSLCFCHDYGPIWKLNGWSACYSLSCGRSECLYQI